MRLRVRAAAFMVAVTAAVSLSPADTQTRPPKRRVWNGTVIEERAFSYGGRVRPVSGDVAEYFHYIRVDFRYVEEALPSGGWRPVSQRLSWTGRGRSLAPGYTMTECNGADSFDLSAIPAGDVTRRLTIPCTTTRFANYFGFFAEPPDRINVPLLVSEDQLRDNCSYAEERPGYKYSVWLSDDYEAVVDVDTGRDSAYARFVPVPGRDLQLSVRTSPATPSLFRFVLQRDEVSRFPGYAGNAVVNDEFLDISKMSNLRGRYGNEDPDWIFDERDFKNGKLWNRKLWGVVRADEVQTATLHTSATVSVTAMDYGAAGKLRAYVKGRCGAWQPARFAVAGQSRDALALPFDEDGNLMADALPEYAGPAERDDDEKPDGDGTKGDGLTAFEEYRGFMTAGTTPRTKDLFVAGDAPWLGTDCDKGPLTDKHQRTTPRTKDLFVAGDAPLLGWLAHTFFAPMSGLSVIELCSRHLWDVDSVEQAIAGFDVQTQETLSVPPDSRVVNFTLARAQQTTFQGQTIHKGPQHGLYVTFDRTIPRIAGQQGVAIPTDAGLMGPPKLTAAVVISRDFFTGDNIDEAIAGMAIALMHELGHAVGIPHHPDSRRGQKVILGILDVTPGLSPLQSVGIDLNNSADVALLSSSDLDALVIEPGPGCAKGDPDPAYRAGVFAGCFASVIVRRGQQESGDVACPMRYWITDFFEPPGVRAQYRWTDTVTEAPTPGRDPQSLGVDAWGGGVLRWTLDPPPPRKRLNRLCSSTAGTEENARKDYLNLAGNAGRAEPCDRLIVVNDLAGK